MSELPPLILELRAKAGEALSQMKAVGSEAEHLGTQAEAGSSRAQSGFNKLAGVGKAAFFGVAGAGVVMGAASLKLAANFQEATTQLVTGAGESEDQIAMVRKGLLAMAPAVGMGPEALAKAMFLVESAGFHGAQGLTVMKAAAEGAKIGGADATVVADGLTTAMSDYHISAAKAGIVTSQLIETVASGKTNMAALSGSLHNVLPAAAAAHVGLQQVLGAMATMTGQGISADQASQDLASTIRSLQNPTQGQAAEMDALGLNSTKLATSMGKNGLTGTLTTLVTAITKHMGPAGTVMLSTFKDSAQESAKAKTMLDALPPSVQKLAKGFLNGTITSKDWRAGLKGMTVDQKQLAQEFAATVGRSRGFNDMLKSGGPAVQTFSAALSKATGGATGMNAALALTGANAATFGTNVKNIGSATTEAGGHVKGWGETSKDVNVQLAKLTAGLQAMGVKLGTWLIPKITAIVGWFAKHKTVTIALASVIGGILVVAITAYISKLAIAAAESVGKFAVMIAGWAGLGPAATAAVTEISVAEDELAATSEATGAATSMAFGPIGLAIGAVVLAATLLATHWKQVWGVVKTVISDVWNDGIKPVFGFIKDNWGILFAVITGGLSLLIQHWSDVWSGMKTAAEAVWNDGIKPIWDGIKTAAHVLFEAIEGYVHAWETSFRVAWAGVHAVYSGVIHPVFTAIQTVVHAVIGVISRAVNGFEAIFRTAWHGVQAIYNTVIAPVFGFLQDAFYGLESGLQALGNFWSDIWSGVMTVIQDAWNFIKPIVDSITSAVHGVSSVVGTVAGAVGGAVTGKHGITHGFGLWEDGGWVNASRGAPVPGVVHGGEYVLSTAMLSGKVPIDAGVAAAVLGSAATSGRANSGLSSAGSYRGAAGYNPGSLASVGAAGAQVIEVHSHTYLDGKEIQHTVERKQLQVGLRRGTTYQPFKK